MEFQQARGGAAVHCVIIGFGLEEPSERWIFDYEDIRGEPHAGRVNNINPYLVDAPDVVLVNRSAPICAVPEIGIGNKPIDDGNYLFTDAEKDAFIKQEPKAAQYFRRWLGADEFLNGYQRWCLWLGSGEPAKLREMPHCVERVREGASLPPSQQKCADTETGIDAHQVPRREHADLDVSVDSAGQLRERRLYVPVGFIDPLTFSSNLVKIVPDASLYHFGVITSLMHNAWLRAVCGRLKSDYRYSGGIVYNNFPWPDPTKTQREAITVAGQGVLDARAGTSRLDASRPLRPSIDASGPAQGAPEARPRRGCGLSVAVSSRPRRTV